MTLKQQAFLAAFGASGSIAGAAAAAGIDRSSHYRWLREDVDYAEAYKQAEVEAAGMIEDLAVQRATEGIDEPVLYKGQIVYDRVRDEQGRVIYTQAIDDQGQPIFEENGDPRIEPLMAPLKIRRRSDSILQSLLAAWMPKKYRTNHHIDGDFTHTGIGALTDAQLERIARGGGAGAAPPADQQKQAQDLVP